MRDKSNDSLRVESVNQLVDAGEGMTSVRMSMRDEKCSCGKFSLYQAEKLGHKCVKHRVHKITPEMSEFLDHQKATIRMRNRQFDMERE